MNRNGTVLIALSLASTLALIATQTRLSVAAGAAIVAQRADTAGASDPLSPLWAEAGGARVALSSAGLGMVRTVTVRSLSDGERLYILLEWPDASPDLSFKGPAGNIEQGETLRDAAQLSFAAGKVEPEPSYELAGSTGSVALWHWNSHWQRAVETANASVVGDRTPVEIADMYPFENDLLYYPARAAGNENARESRLGAAEVLIARRGTALRPHPDPKLTAKGVWYDGRWRVLFARPLAPPGDPAPIFDRNRSTFAVALWDGGFGDRDTGPAVSTSIPIYANVPVAANAVRVARLMLEGGWSR